MNNLELFKQWDDLDDDELYELKQTFIANLPETIEAFVGNELDCYIRKLLTTERYALWEQLIKIVMKTPYSQSYHHRSYRAPNNPQKHGLTLWKLLKHLTSKLEIDLNGAFQSTSKSVYDYGDFYYVDELGKLLIACDLFPYLLAYKLNEQDVQIEEHVRDILWRNGAHSMYSKHFVQGILMSDRVDLYMLVGDVLLAAKNQEGARQVIVEAIDEGTLDAQIYFMKLIAEHHLTRFSSVVRAVNVWFGLGYEAKNSKEINYILTESLAALNEPKRIEQLFISDSSLDVFIGFWCLATQNIDDMLTKVELLMNQKPHIQQTILYALHNTELTGVGQLIYPCMLKTKQLHTFLYGFRLLIDTIPGRYYYFDNETVNELLQAYFDERPWLLAHADDWLEQIAKFDTEIKDETYEMNSTPFPFLHFTFHKQHFYELRILLLCVLERTETLKQLALEVPSWPVNAREYFYYGVSQLLQQHQLLIPALQDRSIGIRKQAIELLTKSKYPLANFISAIPKLLALKTGEIRQAVITLLAAQPVAEIEALAHELLLSKQEAVRVGILELLVTMKEDLTHDFSKVIKQPTEKEQQLIAQLVKKEENFATAPIPPIHEKITPTKEITFTFKDLIHYDFVSLKSKLLDLSKLIESYQHIAYTVKNYAGEEQERLIGESLEIDATKPVTIDSIDQLPLSDMWTKWLVESKLTDEDVCVFLYVSRLTDSYFMSSLSAKGKKFLKNYFGDVSLSALFNTLKDIAFYHQINTIMHYAIAQGNAPLQQQLKERFKTIDYVQFCSCMLMDFYANVNIEEDMVDYSFSGNTTLHIYLFYAAFEEMSDYAKTTKQSVQLLYTTALFFNHDVEKFNFLSIHGLMELFNAGIIDERHIRRLLVSERFCHLLSKNEENLNKLPRFYELEAIINEVSHFIVEQELARGDLQTPVTRYVPYLSSIDASKYFVRLLKALENEKLSRQWLYSVQTRKESLSVLLQKLHVNQIDQHAFFTQLDEANFEPKRLIEVMLYNTSLLSLLSEYIGWPGLEQTAWYFVSHTAENTSDYEKVKIAEYSAIAIEDFQRGAFDRNWFIQAYNAMEPSQFKIVYDAAKYSTSGANHRRAQLYARASLGQLDRATLRNEIEQKRNQDKLRAYSLLPVTIVEAKECYLFLQHFLKQSKQFGAQRRASEAAAVEMAIQNLAEQVSSGNATQFMWQMENERFLELEQYFSPQTIDDFELQLIQQETGKIQLSINKASKTLKSVPKKIAKNAQVVAMQEARKELMEQYSRTRLQLERAMCEEALFDSQLIYTLAKNSTFEQLFSNLVWMQADKFYMLKKSAFVSIDHKEVNVKGNVQIAHPYHLYEAGVWRAWQHHAFTAKWKQPFKQLFRELYLVTEDEKQKSATNRFEGYQVQPNKAITMLKSRGWKTGYYEPLRKISYHYNTISVIDFIYNFLTAAEVEAPTLQEVTFVERLTHKPILLSNVPAVHFSEVLRDIDLVVSVAHVGEVDPEASHSTTEMRAVIIEQLANLLQVENVRVKLPHVLINGKLGNYSIHLGSGLVHQLGGVQIPVLAVPSQHRGRVFLPFVDEDPKTAEIAAKVLLFSDDENIKDPSIRKYIQ